MYLMQVNAAGDMCAICQEKMHAPILLRCKHIFCEDCVSEWLVYFCPRVIFFSIDLLLPYSLAWLASILDIVCLGLVNLRVFCTLQLVIGHVYGDFLAVVCICLFCLS